MTVLLLSEARPCLLPGSGMQSTFGKLWASHSRTRPMDMAQGKSLEDFQGFNLESENSLKRSENIKPVLNLVFSLYSFTFSWHIKIVHLHGETSAVPTRMYAGKISSQENISIFSSIWWKCLKSLLHILRNSTELSLCGQPTAQHIRSACCVSLPICPSIFLHCSFHFQGPKNTSHSPTPRNEHRRVSTQISKYPRL